MSSRRPRTPGRYFRAARRLALRSVARAELRLGRRPEPATPLVDAHNHLGHDFAGLGSVFAGRWPYRPVEELVRVLDRAGVETVIDLDGGFGTALRREIDRYQVPFPYRFAVFCGLNYEAISSERAFGQVEARRLRESAALGARGLKVWKCLGLRLRDVSGALIAIDDARLDPLWSTAADLNLPVVIHVADPPAFFEPLNGRNPRRSELLDHPSWHHYPLRPRGQVRDPRVPSHPELIDQFERLLERHPSTTFVAAHFASLADDLRRLDALLGAWPNLAVDTAGRLSTLTGDPDEIRAFFVRHVERVIFGTDAPPDVDWYRMHRHFFSTRDRSLAYHRGEWPTGGVRNLTERGLGLPAEVLEKVFRENARRILLAQSPVTAASPRA